MTDLIQSTEDKGRETERINKIRSMYERAGFNSL